MEHRPANMAGGLCPTGHKERANLTNGFTVYGHPTLRCSSQDLLRLWLKPNPKAQQHESVAFVLSGEIPAHPETQHVIKDGEDQSRLYVGFGRALRLRVVNCESYSSRYVLAARDEFGISGKPATISRIAILTGLTRKEVQALLNIPVIREVRYVDQYNRAARVITGWLRDPDLETATAIRFHSV